MNRLIKIAMLLLAISLLVLGWYLFVKANDFEVRIKVKGAPGSIYKNVIDWNKGLNKSNLEAVILEQIPFNKIVNTYNFEDHHLLMNWNIEAINDSISSALISIDELDHPIKTRIAKLLGSSPLEELIEQEFSGFNYVLVNSLDRFSVTVDSQTVAPEAFVAYMNLSCHQDKKAEYMIMNSLFINSFLQEQGWKVTSNPFLEILSWDKITGAINFNFCFPIDETKNMKSHETIKYKKVAARKAVKATFHGNYSFTDEAWYALHQHIEKNNLKPLNTIIEVFHENPHTVAATDINWEASIYMEIE